VALILLILKKSTSSTSTTRLLQKPCLNATAQQIPWLTVRNVEALAGRKKGAVVSLVDLQLVRQFRTRAPLRTWSNIMVKPSTNKSFHSAIQVDARLPALKENLPTSKSDLTFRQPGSPAGSFPHTPWWHCKYLCCDCSLLKRIMTTFVLFVPSCCIIS